MIPDVIALQLPDRCGSWFTARTFSRMKVKVGERQRRFFWVFRWTEYIEEYAQSSEEFLDECVATAICTSQSSRLVIHDFRDTGLGYATAYTAVIWQDGVYYV